jgi:hypothetical protein
MLDHLRQTVALALAQETAVTLSTFGEAGLQAGLFPCAAAGLRLFLLVPSTADLLQNLIPRDEVVVTGTGWQGRGAAWLPGPQAACAVPALLQRAESRWSTLVEIALSRFEKLNPQGWGASETIDLEGYDGPDY